MKRIEFDSYTHPDRDFHNWGVPAWKQSLLRMHDYYATSSSCFKGPACWQALVVTGRATGVDVPEDLTSLFLPATGVSGVVLERLAPLAVPGGMAGHSCRARLEQWGTHGVLTPGEVIQSPLGLRVEFSTLMFPADEAIRRVSAEYPGLEFRLTYANRANGRGGEFLFNSGEVVSESREGTLRLDRWTAVGKGAEYWVDEISDPWGSFGLEQPTAKDLAWLAIHGLKYHQDQVLRSLRQPMVRAYVLATRSRRMNEGSECSRLMTLALGVELKLDKHVNLAVARKKGMAECAEFSESVVNGKCLTVSPEMNEDWLDEHLVLIHASNWIRHQASTYDSVWRPFRDRGSVMEPSVLKARMCQMIGARFPQSRVANEAIAMGVRLH